MEERKVITMAELEDFMGAREGRVFDVGSADTFGFSVDIVCKGVHFDKSMNDNTDYICMIFICDCGEVQIQPDIIEEIYLEPDNTITIEFDENFPDLEIKFRE